MSILPLLKPLPDSQLYSRALSLTGRRRGTLPANSLCWRPGRDNYKLRIAEIAEALGGLYLKSVRTKSKNGGVQSKQAKTWTIPRFGSFGCPYVVTSTAMICQHRCHFYCLKGRHNSSSSTDDVHEAGAVCLHDKLWMHLCLQNSTTIKRSLQARTKSLLNLTESSSPSVTFLFMAYDARQILGLQLCHSSCWQTLWMQILSRRCRKCLSEAQGPASPPGHLGKVLSWWSARLHAKHCKHALVFRSCSKKSSALVSTLFVFVYFLCLFCVYRCCIDIIYIAWYDLI